MDAAADRDLLQRCREGSEGAFRQLVERHQAAVFSALLTRGEEAARAEELAHEVFLRMYRGLPYLQGPVDLPEWTQRIVTGLAGPDTGGRALTQPPVPAGFSDRVVRSARRDWLRSEERFDWWFNAGIGATVLLIGIGILMVLQTSGFAGVIREFVRQLTGE